MSARQPPIVVCRPVDLRGCERLEDVRAAFAEAEAVPLGEAWRDAPSPAFAPGSIRTGWMGDTVCVFAELTDRDIFTRATAHNQRFWELGDTFEMFFRPGRQSAYVEFHVTPSNLRLQLRFQDDRWMTREPRVDPFSAALVPGERFRSRTWVRAETTRWWVLAEIPSASVVDEPAPLERSIWRFSCSRYDARRGSEAPVISSTSPHAQPAFHRQQEWGTLRFEG